MNYSGNLVLAAAMLVSSVVLLLSLSRKRVPPPPAHDILQCHRVKAPRSCLLPSDGRKGERKKKKRVKFADDVKQDCSVRSSTEESKKLQRRRKIEEQGRAGMQSNGVVPVLIHHHL